MQTTPPKTLATLVSITVGANVTVTSLLFELQELRKSVNRCLGCGKTSKQRIVKGNKTSLNQPNENVIEPLFEL